MGWDWFGATGNDEEDEEDEDGAKGEPAVDRNIVLVRTPFGPLLTATTRLTLDRKLLA